MPKYGRRRKSIRSRRRRSNRRTSRRYKRRGSRVNRVISRSSPFPDRYMTKLRYSEYITMTYGGLSIPAAYTYLMNSIYDPNHTAVGHQPLGHDELATMYNKYRVYGCKYKFTFQNQSTAEQPEMMILLRPNTTVVGDANTIRESQYCTFKTVMGVEASSSSIQRATGYASVSKIRGINKYQMRGENDYSAIFGNNPPITPTIQIYIFNTNVGTGVSCRVRADLTYYVECYDRKALNAS